MERQLYIAACTLLHRYMNENSTRYVGAVCLFTVQYVFKQMQRDSEATQRAGKVVAFIRAERLRKKADTTESVFLLQKYLCRNNRVQHNSIPLGHFEVVVHA